MRVETPRGRGDLFLNRCLTGDGPLDATGVGAGFQDLILGRDRELAAAVHARLSRAVFRLAPRAKPPSIGTDPARGPIITASADLVRGRRRQQVHTSSIGLVRLNLQPAGGTDGGNCSPQMDTDAEESLVICHWSFAMRRQFLALQVTND
jgi:hypothetical protein